MIDATDPDGLLRTNLTINAEILLYRAPYE